MKNKLIRTLRVIGGNTQLKIGLLMLCVLLLVALLIGFLYLNQFREGLIDALGYGGWIGCEYRPRAGTSAGLGWRMPTAQ